MSKLRDVIIFVQAIIIIGLLLTVIIVSRHSIGVQTGSVIEDNLIRSEETALKIGIALLDEHVKELYPEGILSEESVYSRAIAIEYDETWRIRLSLPEEYFGGGSFIEFRKRDGRVVGIGYED